MVVFWVEIDVAWSRKSGITNLPSSLLNDYFAFKVLAG
jgi:hypothetical protein